jgi:peptidoglycan hydrolase CwlO-like protein
MVLDTVEIILAIVIAIGTVVSSAALGVRWLVKHYLQELKTNGGSSLKDQVNRLESRMDNADAWGKETYRKVEKLDHQIDDLYTKFIEYLSNNNK